MACKKTRAIGVRVHEDLYERIKKNDPTFNLSKFVTDALVKRYGSIEENVDLVLEQKGMM